MSVNQSAAKLYQSVAFASAHTLVLDVPVFLLTFDAAVARVPATVIHGLLLTVIALTNTTHFTHHSTDTHDTFHTSQH